MRVVTGQDKKCQMSAFDCRCDMSWAKTESVGLQLQDVFYKSDLSFSQKRVSI